ncbi:MAG: 50S ribosomal protein L17 [Deltaproteobacteria bacterium]|nr:50S ribosomal protein L17 [Deltaproteobacteria bacterium]
MRHRNSGRKLNRTTSHRLAMLKNMVTSLLRHERIETTEAKAKEVRRLAEKLITLSKRGDLSARRRAFRIIRDKKVLKKLFNEIKNRYQNVNGGYTRIIKIGVRRGDGAHKALIELVR